MAPQRIQLRRTRGWRKPEGAIVVSRPSKWGNPYQISKSGLGGWMVRGNGKCIWPLDEPWSKTEAASVAVEEFRDMYRPRSINAREARIHLAGHDLACWCPLDQPCHADVLLELANDGTP